MSKNRIIRREKHLKKQLEKFSFEFLIPSSNQNHRDFCNQIASVLHSKFQYKCH